MFYPHSLLQGRFPFSSLLSQPPRFRSGVSKSQSQCRIHVRLNNPVELLQICRSIKPLFGKCVEHKMEQNISEIGSLRSTMPHQSKENETKKRPDFTDADSCLDSTSSGKRICVELSETSPKENSLHCISSGEINLCKESGLDDDSPQSAVSDTHTPADGSRPTLTEESIEMCRSENNGLNDGGLNDVVASEEDDQKQKGQVLCSMTGDLLNSSVGSMLSSSADSSLVSGSTKSKCMEGSTAELDLPKDGDPIDLSNERICGVNGSIVSNATYAVPALISANISEPISCCQEDQNSASSSLLRSEQINVKDVGKCRKKLLILDVNGLLADILPSPEPGYVPDTQLAMKAVFQRTFCRDFLQFCFDNFNVGVWSSRNRKNVDKVVDFLMGDKKKNLLFCWDQSYCTDTGYGTIQDRNKPLFLKEIRKLWDKEDPDLPWEKGDYNESNSLLMDDSPHKALRNPPYTGIFPDPYVYKDQMDTFLGPRGRLRSYLQRLVKAEHVQRFVEKNPFGQRPITKLSSSWAFYSKIVSPSGSSEPAKKGGHDRLIEPKNNAEQDPPCEGVASEKQQPVVLAAAEGSADRVLRSFTEKNLHYSFDCCVFEFILDSPM